MSTPPPPGSPDWYRFGISLGGKIEFDTSANLRASHPIIPPNPKRRALLLIGPNTGRVTLSNENPVTIDNGLTITNTAGVVELYFEFVGDVINRPWYGIYPAGATPMAWIDVVDMER